VGLRDYYVWMRANKMGVCSRIYKIIGGIYTAQVLNLCNIHKLTSYIQLFVMLPTIIMKHNLMLNISFTIVGFTPITFFLLTKTKRYSFIQIDRVHQIQTSLKM